MRFVDIMGANLERNVRMMEMTLADFSDADLLVRPVPGANHAAWQLGHLIASETRMVQGNGGTGATLPAGFAEKFTKATASSDDPAKFPGKAELLRVFREARAATIAWVKGLSDADLARACPEPMRQYIPTVGDLAVLVVGHQSMHLGQFQVIRRKLGKPILF